MTIEEKEKEITRLQQEIQEERSSVKQAKKNAFIDLFSLKKSDVLLSNACGKYFGHISSFVLYISELPTNEQKRFCESNDAVGHVIRYRMRQLI